jgi:selenocysteine lyase/cysteine desulfurase
VSKWVLARGLETIHHQEMRLTRMLVEGLKEIEGVTLYCQEPTRFAILASFLLMSEDWKLMSRNIAGC